MKITVIELLENGNYLIGFELDGEDLGEREMDLPELRTFIVEGIVKVEYLEEVSFDEITVEQYEGEFDVNINTYTYYAGGDSYECEFVKTYKTLKGALNKAYKLGDYVTLINC